MGERCDAKNKLIRKSGIESLTQIQFDSLHIGPDSRGAMFRIRVSIAVTEKVCGYNGYACKRNHEQWTCNPPKLSHAPSKRQNSCPNHSCYYMCYSRPLGPFTKYINISPNNQLHQSLKLPNKLYFITAQILTL